MNLLDGNFEVNFEAGTGLRRCLHEGGALLDIGKQGDPTTFSCSYAEDTDLPPDYKA